MNNKQLSRLGFLMDRFSITGRELSNALHVDFTLVSKWRNRTRVLAPRSIHLKKIIEYFVALDSNTQYSTLVKILSESYPNAQLTSDNEISLFLSKWLSDKDDSSENCDLPIDIVNNKNVNKGEFYIFKDNAGRREAIINFMDIALSLPEGQELLLFSQENSEWFYEDKEFLNIWREKNLEFLRRKGKIRVIHTVDRLYKSIAFSLIKWLPLHMTGNTVSYYYPQFMDNPIKTTLYILKDHTVISGITSEGFTKTVYTFMCFDPIALQQSQHVFQSLLASSLPLFEKYLPYQADKLANLIVKAAEEEENNYYVNMPPSFFIMSRELLYNIFAENNLSNESIEMCINYYNSLQKQFYANSSQNYYRFIYDIIRLEQVLESDEIYFSELSTLTGRHITVTRKLFCQCLQEMISVLKNTPNFEIALLEGPPSSGLYGINLWIKENTITVSNTADINTNSPFSLATQELTAVNSCFHHFNQIWNATPQIKRDKNWVVQRLYHAMSKHKF